MRDDEEPKTGEFARPQPGAILAALVRQTGRVRISPRELKDIEGGTLKFRRAETGDIVISFEVKA